MPLILAIEPDRRQANQLNAIVRGRLHAELVLADSAERALAALGERIPDLILTSALLSPNDEVVLGERLRALDATTAHVQTLTIPVLASRPHHEAESGGGVLSALRRVRNRSAATDGCDPAVFAAQCSEYLERAVAERKSNTAAVDRDHEAPVSRVEPPAVEAVAEAVAPAPKLPAPKPVPVEEPIHPVRVDRETAAAAVQEAIARLEAMSEFQSIEPDNFVELDLSSMLDEPGEGRTLEAATDEEEPDVYDISAIDGDAFAEPAQMVAAPAPPSSARPSASEVSMPARLGVLRLWPEIEGMIAEPEAALAASQSSSRYRLTQASRRGHALQPKPVQDEWGFFDPEQCGFAALLAKLDEIVDGDESVERPRPA